MARACQEAFDILKSERKKERPLHHSKKVLNINLSVKEIWGTFDSILRGSLREIFATVA